MPKGRACPEAQMPMYPMKYTYISKRVDTAQPVVDGVQGALAVKAPRELAPLGKRKWR